MTASVITKVLTTLAQRLELAKTDSFYSASLGYQRITVLPRKTRLAINLACVTKGEANDNSMKVFFDKMTEEEFVNWLKAN